MLVINRPTEMQAFSKAQRAAGKIIGFVPTMGYFHEGHLTLMRQARARADLVVVSLFVNPTQFAPTEDLSKYPRDFDRDCRMAESAGVSVMFFPTPEDMYPDGYQTTVSLGEIPKVLCGVNRPPHFAGVATVCAKLFNIVLPHFAVFGEKDYQQLLVIQQTVADLNMDLEIVPGPLVREPDGLAMSSRNVYLQPEERKQATVLNRSLRHAEQMLRQGIHETTKILDEVTALIRREPLAQIDYIELRALPRLAAAAARPRGRHLLALAVKFGKTRLIDNTVLDFKGTT